MNQVIQGGKTMAIGIFKRLIPLLVFIMMAAQVTEAATAVSPGQMGLAIPPGPLLQGTDSQVIARFDNLKSMGVTILRMDIFWDVVQKSRNGSFNFAEFDRPINYANNRGIKVLPILNGCPSFVNCTFSVAQDQQDFGQFAKAAAAYFKGRVEYFEIFNEPNLRNITPANYTKMLQAAYNGIKSVDSSMLVVAGGTSPVPENSGSVYGAKYYLEQMYKNGAKNYMDAVGFHPYTFPYLPSNTSWWSGFQIMRSDLRQVMINNGDTNKKIWLTELGAPTSAPDSVSEATQSTILTEAVNLTRTYSWAGPLIWYSYQDLGPGQDPENEGYFGLIRPNGSTKPAYTTFKNLAGGGDTPTKDTTAPKAAFVSPTPADRASLLKNKTYTIAVSASDNKGVAKVALYVDGKLIVTDTASPYSMSWKTPTTGRSSPYTLRVRATDTSGNFVDIQRKFYVK